MLPQYAQRQNGGEIAIWLLITVGALLIPIIVIAICCIRRHLARRPHIKLMDNPSLRMMMNTKRAESLRSYNGPYVESGNENGYVISENNINPSLSRTNSLKKQHVHWPDGSIKPKPNDIYPIKKKQFTEENILNTTQLTESPSSHRRSTYTSSALSHIIQTAIIPAGSTVSSTDTNQLLALSKEFTSNSTGTNSIV
ncbi:unnamed protein product [Adineta steineri]|uniref:Uncharacterized protein n=1 Tax=Adineta steineri TaxID=433720 RepID=A0A818I047_9BILA|nr:unnamed protein product [Adineta steineri]CAF3516931.1 unnamed protein product [Adineta steineri]